MTAAGGEPPRCWWCHDAEWEQVIDGRPTCDECRYLAARAAIRAGLIARQPWLKAVQA